MKGLLLPFVLLILACAHAPHQVIASRDQIRFRLSAPEARSVVLVLISEKIKKHASELIAGGMWEVRVPLDTSKPPMDIKYFYLVDGDFFLPSCSMRDIDDFGAENCVLSPTAQLPKK
jgi:hypothetical protein